VDEYAGDGMYPGAEQAETSEARRSELTSQMQAMGAEMEKLQRQAAATSSSHAATPRKVGILYPVCLVQSADCLPSVCSIDASEYFLR